MTAIPKRELMARKRAERAAAGLIEVRLYLRPDMKKTLLDAYHALCDEHEISETLRTNR